MRTDHSLLQEEAFAATGEIGRQKRCQKTGNARISTRFKAVESIK